MNSAELQNKIDTISNKGGNYMELDAYYDIDATIKVPSFFKIIGDGVTIFNVTAPMDNVVLFADTLYSGICKVDIMIPPIYTVNTGIIIWGDANDNMIEDCGISGANIGIAVQARPGENAKNNSDNIIQNNETVRCKTGFYASNVYRLSVEGNYFNRATRACGINICESNNCIIENNECIGNKTHGIYISGCKQTTIRSNRVEGNYLAGLHVRFAGDPDNPVKDEGNVIMGNWFNNNGLDKAQKGNGIHLQAWANRNIITGNICCGNSANGIRVHDEGAVKNLIEGNICLGNGDSPISVEDADNFVSMNIVQ